MPLSDRRYQLPPGYSLIEMMIVVAIIAILASIAIPAYNNYIAEGHYTTIRATLNGMRVPFEDYRLDNGDYGNFGNNRTAAQIEFFYRGVHRPTLLPDFSHERFAGSFHEPRSGCIK